MTEEKIKEILNSQDKFNINEGEYQSYLNTLCNDEYSLEVVDRFGGEGQGDYYWYVIQIKDNKSNEKTFVRFNAYHNSWDGCDWDSDFEIVEPKEVLKIEWHLNEK